MLRRFSSDPYSFSIDSFNSLAALYKMLGFFPNMVQSKMKENYVET